LKKLIFTLLIFFIGLQAQAFEDCLIISKTKLTDIRIENNQMIDVYPLVTIMNEKNVLIVHPLKEGITCFSVRKPNKERELFHVKITADKTEIKDIEGYEILTLDIPPLVEKMFELDLPPIFKGGE